MLIKEDIYLPMADSSRTLHIYMPDDRKDNERFPVLYMFDGHNLFLDEEATYGRSWGMKETFEFMNYRAIIVGLECNHEGNLRLCEFSPYSFSDNYWGQVDACGKELFEWMVHDLKPYIDEKYPTLPESEHTLIGGSSMGGLMAIYGGAIYPHVYSKAACLSPYYTHVLKRLLADIEKSEDLSNSTFYISWGRHEWRTKRALSIGTEENLKVCRLLTKKNAKVYPHCMEHGHHSEESWEKEVPTFVEELQIV